MLTRDVAMLSLLYVFYYAHMGVIAPYLGVYLDARGLSSEAIGELIAIMTVARIIAPNLWASLADKTGKRVRIIQLGATGAFITFLSLFILNGFWGLAIGLVLSIGFWTSITPQLEQYTLLVVNGDPARYSRVRLWGSIGFILMSVICGAVIDAYGSLQVLWCSVAALGLLALSSLLLRDKPLSGRDAGAVGSFWQKVMQTPFVLFALVMILLQMGLGVYNGFFALFLIDLGFTGNESGWIISLGVIAEVGIFLVAGSLLKRLRIQTALVICMLATTVRWLCLSLFAEYAFLVIASQTIHALSFGLAHAAAMKFVHFHFGEKYQSRGQALYASISFGLGGAIGSYVAGMLWAQGSGAQLTWLVAALLTLAGALLAAAIRIEFNQDPAAN